MDFGGRPIKYVAKRLRFSNGDVDLSNQTTPTAAGQVLTSLNSTTAEWSTPPVTSLQEIHSSVGVIEGGILALSGTNSFTVTGGRGIITDHSVQPSSTNLITWGTLGVASSPIVCTYLNVANITFISIDKNGNVIQSAFRPEARPSRINIFLGVVVHVNRINVDGVNQEQLSILDPANMLRDTLEMIGFMNEGNTMSGNSGALTINKSVGYMFGYGLNFVNDRLNPHKLLIPSAPSATFQYRFCDGSNGVTGTLLDPNNMDNLSGGLTLLSNNHWSVQRVYLFSSRNIKIQRGQHEYTSSQRAIDGITRDPFIVETSIALNGMLISYIVTQRGITETLDPVGCIFLTVGRFGGSAGVVGTVTGPAEDLATTTNPVNVGNSSAPITGQILAATSSATASWRNPFTLQETFNVSGGDPAIDLGVNALQIVNPNLGKNLSLQMWQEDIAPTIKFFSDGEIVCKYLTGGTAGSIYYQNASNVLTALPKPVNDESVLSLTGGLPSWKPRLPDTISKVTQTNNSSTVSTSLFIGQGNPAGLTLNYGSTTGWDLSTNFKFTAPVGGLYSVNASGKWDDSNAGIVLRVYKNGSIFQELYREAGNTTLRMATASCNVILNGTTDYIQVELFSGDTSWFSKAGSFIEVMRISELTS